MQRYHITVEYFDDGRLSQADHEALAAAAVKAVERMRQGRIEAHARAARWAKKWGKQPEVKETQP